jgi:serine/threonine protein kinase
MMYLHEIGIIHRDLKGDNVLVTKDYFSCKIADLGESTSKYNKDKDYKPINRNDIYKTVKIKGTPTHMAPEMLLFNQFNNKADVYSYGSFLYELLTNDNNPIPDCETFESIKDFFNSKNTIKVDNEKIIIQNEIIKDFFLKIAEDCWRLSHTERPNFTEIIIEFEKVIELLREEIYKDLLLEDKDILTTLIEYKNLKSLDQILEIPNDLVFNCSDPLYVDLGLLYIGERHNFKNYNYGKLKNQRVLISTIPKIEGYGDVIKSIRKIISLRLNHINVERCIGWSEDSEYLYYAFSVPDSFTFLTKIYSSLSDTDKLKILMNIAYGIKYLSDLKIIHMNLKVDNIIVNLKNNSRLMKKL